MGILYPSGNKKLLVLSKYEIKDVILPVDITDIMINGMK